MEYEDLVTVDPDHSRKRKSNPCNWKKNILKKSKRSGTGKIPSVACNHDGSIGKCEAYQLAAGDLDILHGIFYQNGDRRGQDGFILKCISESKPLRLRPRKHNNSRRVVLKYEVFYRITDFKYAL